MKKNLVIALATAAMMFSGAVLADVTIPDGPVEAPPGMKCWAKAGKVYCVALKTSGTGGA